MDGFLVDVIGWIGAVLLLGAYGLVSFKKILPDSFAYQFLNVAASILLLANTIFYGAYPSSFVNAVWTVIALVAIAAVVRRNATNSN
jgi:hypothetical protein